MARNLVQGGLQQKTWPTLWPEPEEATQTTEKKDKKSKVCAKPMPKPKTWPTPCCAKPKPMPKLLMSRLLLRPKPMSKPKTMPTRFPKPESGTPTKEKKDKKKDNKDKTKEKKTRKKVAKKQAKQEAKMRKRFDDWLNDLSASVADYIEEDLKLSRQEIHDDIQ